MRARIPGAQGAVPRLCDLQGAGGRPGKPTGAVHLHTCSFSSLDLDRGSQTLCYAGVLEQFWVNPCKSLAQLGGLKLIPKSEGKMVLFG